MFSEFIQRGMGTVVSGFDFYRRYFFPFGNQKIDLHMVFPVPTVGTGIEIQARPAVAEHLCDNVFHQHPLIDIQLIKKDRTIKLVFCVFLVLNVCVTSSPVSAM